MHDELIAARIDRLPRSVLHRRLLLLVAFPLFFDSVDIFTLPSAAPGLMRAWGIGIQVVASLISASFFGMFLGALGGGALSDVIGRRRALIGFVAFASAASVLTAAAPDLRWLLIGRVLTGMGLAAGMVTALTYIAEMFPATSRGGWQGWAMVIALCAIPLTNWIALLVVPAGPEGWRWIFAWGAVGLAFLALSPGLLESPRWLARQGRLADAELVLGRMEATVIAEHGPLPPPQPLAPSGAPRAPWTAMFGPEYRLRTAVLGTIWVFQTLGFYGFEAWVPTLLVKHGITLVHSLTYVTLGNLGAPLGALLASQISDRFERKHTIAAAAFAIALCGLLYGLSFVPALIVVFGFLLGVLIQTFASLLYAYTPEQFPTDMRNGATGFTYSLGRIANVANAFIIAAVFTHFGFLAVFVYIAAAWAGTGVLTLAFGPRTTGRRLEVVSPVAVLADPAGGTVEAGQ